MKLSEILKAQIDDLHKKRSEMHERIESADDSGQPKVELIKKLSEVSEQIESLEKFLSTKSD